MTSSWAREGNLPADLTTFVGRRREVAELARMVRSSRLVTLTGAAGVGKTRLALHVTRMIRAEFPDGAWMVELSALQDPGLLAHTVCTTLRTAGQAARSPAGALAGHLRDKRLLLVLDTCEHLAEACAGLVRRLLAEAPGVTVVATSRRPLGLAAEIVYPVGPLPDADALDLLFDRAPVAVRTSEATLLVRRLDGIPLAIELAAVRLRTMTLAEIVERLGDRFQLLHGDLEGPPRHQTMRTTIGWSHELCEPLERLLWARLSVFSGDFDLEGAQTVCGDRRLPPGRFPAALDGLVAKSIVQPLPCGRYRMLDLVREYGAQWLRRLGEEGLMRFAHRDYYLGLARQFDDEWFGPDQVAWCRRMRAELPNLRAALEFCLTDADEPDVGLELVARLAFLWIAGGHLAEGRHHVDRALALADTPPEACHRALWVGAWLATFQGDLDRADDLSGECLVRSVATGDADGAGWATCCAAITAVYSGRITEALALYDRAESFHRRAGDRGAGLAHMLIGKAFVLCELGRPGNALAYLDRLRTLCRTRGDLWMDSYGEWLRALIELGRGEAEAADRHARAALRVKARLHDTLGMATALVALAGSALAQGQAERTARLLGIGALVEHTYGLRLGSTRLGDIRRRADREARALLGDCDFATAYMEGFSLTLDQAVAYAAESKT
ncbi:ATP-binding protein [Thermoactinospora rubra]|uniref:ATP-binding protein n=1 Tax=Thermoactinospora rubra TaxID=1088767 RepID=UPI000A11CC4A|nr:NB-ARC domain-containing protein [Thermoactinospora rubra]